MIRLEIIVDADNNLIRMEKTESKHPQSRSQVVYQDIQGG